MESYQGVVSPAPIGLVVARAENGVIGKDGALPWHIPADFRHFKEVTGGTAMVMGRKTFDSLPGILPGRRHLVLTRDPNWKPKGVEVVHSVEEAVSQAGNEPISAIGGAEIFRLFEPLAAFVELTEVHLAAEGDTVMPAFDPARWHETGRRSFVAENGHPAFSFVRLERKQSD